MKHVLFTALAFAGVRALAADCQGEMVTPIYMCTHTEAGTDIRLYVQEYQTCENGKITRLDRDYNGLYNHAEGTAADSAMINQDQVQITFAPQRTRVPDRADDLTMDYPTAATLTVPDGRVEMQMTTTIAPDYEGATTDEEHYVGTFQRYDVKGAKLEEGPLSCFVVQ